MLISILLTLTLATADNTPSTTASGKESTNPDDKVVCQYTMRTGTYLKQTRVCKTKAEWRKNPKESAQFRRNVDQIYGQLPDQISNGAPK